MKKIIIIIGLALMLANLAFAADKEIFKSMDNNVVMLSDTCTATAIASEDIELPEGGAVKSTGQTLVKCVGNGRITVKKDSIIIGNLDLWASTFKVDNTGKYAGVIHMVTPLDMEVDNEILQVINGMNVETSKGINIDFWNGKDIMDKKYDSKYFDSFMYRLVPTTDPEPVKGNDGKAILDPNPAFAGKNVPKNVVVKFRGQKDIENLPSLNVCGQEFHHAWAETAYGPSTSSAAGTNPNTLSGRKVVSDHVTEIFVEKEDSSRKAFKENFGDKADYSQKSNCIAKAYTLTTNGDALDEVYTSSDIDRNYCGVFFTGPNSNSLFNIKCKQNIDINGDYKAELFCDSQDCRTASVMVTQKLNEKQNPDANALFLNFNKENPLYKITTTKGSEESDAQHEVEFDVGPNEDGKIAKEPKGFVIYDQNNDTYIENPIVIGINMRSQVVVPAGYRWFGGAIWPRSTVQKGLKEGAIKSTRGGEFPSQIYAWQAPVTKEEKKAVIVPKGDYFSVLLKGGNVIFKENNVRQDFLMTNKYLYDESKKDFLGYEIKIRGGNNLKVFEIARIESKEKNAAKIEGIDIRELKTNVETPIMAGVESVQAVDGNPIHGKECKAPSDIGVFLNNQDCGEFSGLCDAKAKLCIKIGCHEDSDCSTGYNCKSNICKANSAKRCNRHTDCGSNFECDSDKKVCHASKCGSGSDCTNIDKDSMCSMLPGYENEGVCAKKGTPGILVGRTVGMPEEVEVVKRGYTPSVIILEPLAKGEISSQVNAYFIYKTSQIESVNDLVNKFSPCMGSQTDANAFMAKLRELNPDIPSQTNMPLGERELKIPNLGYSYNKGGTQFNINRCIWAAKSSIANAVKARMPQVSARGISEYMCQNDEECIVSRGKCKNIVNGMGNCVKDENLKIVKRGIQFCIGDACMPMCKDGDAGFPQPKYQKSFATTYMLDKNGELLRLPAIEDVCGTKERNEQNVLFEATCLGENIKVVPTQCEDGCKDGKCNIATVAEIMCRNDRDCADLGDGYECIDGDCVKKAAQRSSPAAAA